MRDQVRDVEQQSATVAGLAQEAGELRFLTQRQRAQRLRDDPDAQRLDLEGDLARASVLDDRRGMLQRRVEGRYAGRGVAQGAAFEQLRAQDQPVVPCRFVARRPGCGRVADQLADSEEAAALRDSSFSTAFIITDGPVSALSLDTVRWRSTASL